MKGVGIICDFDYSRHHLFKSYFYSINNLYGKPHIIKSIDDLQYPMDLLFIGDDHYGPHKAIWRNDRFVDECNRLKINVIALTNERILDSFFPWNKEDFIFLRKFDNLTHYANDVDDCIKLGLKINRQAMSRSLQSLGFTPEKKNKMVFIGNTNCKSYQERKMVLNEVKKYIDIDIIASTIPTWEEYMNVIAGYRFVLSPIGNGNFFPMRFYETLAVGSIPVHQVRDNTLSYYKIEAGFDDCIFFKETTELKEKIKNFAILESHNRLWMEDNLEVLLRKDYLL